MRIFILFYFICFIGVICNSQTTFQSGLDFNENGNTNVYFLDTEELSTGEILSTGIKSTFSIFCISSNDGLSHNCFSFNQSGSLDFIADAEEDVEGNIYFILYGNSNEGTYTSVVKMSENYDFIWSKRLNIGSSVAGSNVARIHSDSSGKVFAVLLTYGGTLGSIKIAELDSESGGIIAENNIKVDESSSGMFESNMLLLKEVDGKLIINLTINHPQIPAFASSRLVYFDIESFSVTHQIVFPDKEYLLSDTFSNGDLLIQRLGTEENDFPQGDVGILRMNTAGEVIWSKKIDINPYKKFSSSVLINSNDDIYLIANEFQNSFNQIYKLNDDGEIIWGKGYSGQEVSFYGTTIATNNDIVFWSALKGQDGFNDRVLNRISQSGDLEGYEPREICYDEPTDFVPEFITEEVYEIDHYFFEDGSVGLLDILVQPITILQPISSDPNFIFPQEFCVGDSSDVSNINNEYASSITWFVEGTTDYNSSNSSPGQLSWSQPGTYTIRQTIVFEGCTYEYELETVVSDLPLFDLPDTTVICAPAVDIVLDAAAQNVATDYLWNTGATTPQITADTAGSYAVTVTNVHCSAEAQTRVVDLDPTFDLPARICLDNCAAVNNLHNADAQTTLWTFTNAENPTSDQAVPPAICFTETGKQYVSQTVTFGQCSETFTDSIDLLPVPRPNLGTDLEICEGETATLAPPAQTDLSYTWSTGATDAQIEVPVAGTYSVTVANAVCSRADTVTVSYTAAAAPALALPPDTLLCARDLPLFLAPDLSDTDAFAWLDPTTGDTRTDSIFAVTAAGDYLLQVEQDGCLYDYFVEITTRDCAARIYIPTAFSPNNDGINDLFTAYGENFRLTSMRIFDRWGNLYFSEEGANIAWDGSSRGRLAETGVYVYVAEWVNELTGETGVLSGDVTVAE